MNEEYRKPYQYQAELDRQRYNQVDMLLFVIS